MYSNLYCQQLTRLKQALDEKRPKLANVKGVVLHQDIARPYTSLKTRWKLRELEWEVKSHSPYSPYHFLNGKNLATREAVKMSWSSFIPIETRISSIAKLRNGEYLI
ncbi:PREDICTED: histone-lysine N-methyltransferase SETMAR-like [Nicrophorus vespilloides]|uniref:Histone-lysine N-methyltransferase SETMAR-like n=1 Tax=Nicrophorus vespilloides TaxID=110193 RepID=A0ABM1MUY6_NICVS|nr:PREDICTED: histone-lysine N-methyltransferase SETMAR-like [Nicrophorus vespilloides]